MTGLYRVLRRLAHKDAYIEVGTVAVLPFNASALAVLETRGAIAPVSTPPLSVLPGWSDRAQLASQHGIVTIADLIAALRADSQQVARWFRASPEEVASWQQQLIKEWLVAPPPRNG